ncbi:MAG: RluA family pseudouridine synthase [Lachnospiraceae bacterium]|nr:RluA family pseudouridine synthase [Lachnospiraceae bacterium]
MSNYFVEPEQEGLRLDVFLNQMEENQSRSAIQKQIKEGRVTVNGDRTKPSYSVCAGDEVFLVGQEPVEVAIVPENIPLDILFEDEDLLVVNKPKGMVVHPAPGHITGTLVNAVMFHCKESLSGINGELRPGIVHRIDRDTTGSLIVCKNDASHNHIASQIKEHSVNRVYRGIVLGNVSEEDGCIHAPIGRHPVERKKMAVNERNGKDAITHYRVLKRFEKYTYMEFKLETGRTHQIRVHMASIGHPLLGDDVYGPPKCPFHLEGQTLHAAIIGFVHPRSGEYIEVEAPLPEYFQHLLDIL